ncbi:hypothetical protein J2Y64_000001, partial [Aeromonas salmonicida]|nr:hypothetical protein [Aeromonas salmonicida]
QTVSVQFLHNPGASIYGLIIPDTILGGTVATIT